MRRWGRQIVGWTCDALRTTEGEGWTGDVALGTRFGGVDLSCAVLVEVGQAAGGRCLVPAFDGLDRE